MRRADRAADAFAAKVLWVVRPTASRFRTSKCSASAIRNSETSSLTIKDPTAEP